MRCGAIFSGYDARDYKLIYTASTADFPSEFELEMRRIKNQGSVGSCVAHSLSSIIEYYNFNQTGDDSEMSVGYIYGNRKTSDYKSEGMIMRDALEAFRKYGNVRKELFPYNEEVPKMIMLFDRQHKHLHKDAYPNRISQYARVTSPNAIKASLMAGNPVLMAMIWYGDMEVKDGVLVTDEYYYEGGHCMFIYGWDERGWKVQNSWGEDWGNHGTMIVPYNMPIEEFWTLTDDIIEGAEVKKPYSSKPGRIIAKIINKVNKIFKR